MSPGQRTRSTPSGSAAGAGGAGHPPQPRSETPREVPDRRRNGRSGTRTAPPPDRSLRMSGRRKTATRRQRSLLESRAASGLSRGRAAGGLGVVRELRIRHLSSLVGSAPVAVVPGFVEVTVLRVRVALLPVDVLTGGALHPIRLTAVALRFVFGHGMPFCILSALP